MSSAGHVRAGFAGMAGYVVGGVYLALVVFVSSWGADWFARMLLAVVGLLPMAVVLAVVVVVRLVRHSRELRLAKQGPLLVLVCTMGVVLLFGLADILVALLS